MGQKTDFYAAMETEQSDGGGISISEESPHQLQLQPGIVKKKTNSTNRFAEVAGGTTAECAAICCCIPCGILNLLVLTAVRLPAGLCFRVFKKRTLVGRSKKRAAFLGSGSDESTNSKTGWSAGKSDSMKLPGVQVGLVAGDSWPMRSPAVEVVELEEKVWSKFFGSGFWRSPSQREDR